MLHTMQWAIIKKDLQSITTNKQVFVTILMVPLALTIVLPTIFIMMVHFVPLDSLNLQALLEMIPRTGADQDVKQSLIKLLMNNIMPVFFLMIPIMASSVMAASSFVGEKEKQTLETLLYCPLPLKKIFQSKIVAAFLLSMIVSFTSFFAMLIVTQVEILVLMGTMFLPSISWLVILLLASPAISFIAITITVRGSAKAQTVEEAQQRAVFLILPILLFIIGQFMGIMLVNTWITLGLSIALILLAWLLVRGVTRKLSYEMLLK
ncbi:MAG: ABC transporter permease [Enterococcus durans]